MAVLVAVGQWAEAIRKGYEESAGSNDKALTAKNADEASQAIGDIINEGDVALIKGSRMLKLETIVPCLEKAVTGRGEGG